jgi:hypothetical protein
MYSVRKKSAKKAYLILISSVVEVEARPRKLGVLSSSISMMMSSLTAFLLLQRQKYGSSGYMSIFRRYFLRPFQFMTDGSIS